MPHVRSVFIPFAVWLLAATAPAAHAQTAVPAQATTPIEASALPPDTSLNQPPPARISARSRSSS
jgi:hypothetical protein